MTACIRKTTTCALFGGALFAAGIITAPADADFSTASTAVSITANDYATTYNVYDNTIGPASVAGPWTLAYLGGHGLAEVTTTSTTASITAGGGSASPPVAGYAFASTSISQITVDVPTSLLVEWNFTDASGEIFISGDLEFGGDFHTLLLETSGAGSQEVDLAPGYVYSVSLLALTFGEGSSTASVSIVPTPGALALLGLAGLVARRRRQS